MYLGKFLSDPHTHTVYTTLIPTCYRQLLVMAVSVTPLWKFGTETVLVQV